MKEGYWAGSVLVTNGSGRPKNILFVLVRLVVNQYGIRIRSMGESLTIGFESAGTSWQASVLQPSHACGLARQESHWSREEARGKCLHQEPESEGTILFPNFVLLMLMNLGCEQCCGSGSRIRCPFDPGSRIRSRFFPDPWSRISDPGPRISDPGSQTYILRTGMTIIETKSLQYFVN